MEPYKCSVKLQKVEKVWKTKIGAKNDDNKEKIVTNMVDTNLTI